jgi:peroxiredoxin
MTIEFEDVFGEVHSRVLKDRLPVVRTQPLLTGDKSPFFSLTNESYEQHGISATHLPGHTTSVLDLIREQPLVISFYCPCWGRYAKPYLEQLVALSGQLKFVGAELLVFSNEPRKSLLRQYPQLDFRVAYDTEFSVARQFGIYSEEDPIWDRISGISDDVFTPALYVIGPDRTIVHHFLDENFDQSFQPEAIINAVASLQETQFEHAYLQ